MAKWIVSIMMVVLLSLGLIATTSNPAAQKPEEFYKGKIINYTIPSSPGGTTDVFGRLFAGEFQKELGSTVVVNNRRGGAGGAEGYSYIYNAPAGGLHIGDGIMVVLWLNEMTKAAGSNWKTDKFSYIYGIGWDPQILQVDPKGPYSTLAALKGGKNLKFAVSSPQGNFALGIMTVARVLGIEGKVIPGMKGEADCALSVKQGESAALVTPVPTSIRIRESIGLQPIAVLAGKRDPRLPDVPALGELIPIKEEDKFLIEQVWGELMRSTWVNLGPPGIPKDKLTYLRKTADKIVAKPDVVSKLPGVMLYTPTPEAMLSGEKLQKLAEETRKLEPKISAAFAEMITKYLKM